MGTVDSGGGLAQFMSCVFPDGRSHQGGPSSLYEATIPHRAQVFLLLTKFPALLIGSSKMLLLGT